MAVETNGKLSESKGANGLANGKANGHAAPPRKAAVKKQKSFGLLSLVARYE